MRILVTGSEGNIGSVLVPYLMGLGYDVVRCDIQNYHAYDYRMIDVKSPGDLATAFHDFQPHVAIHLGAVVSRITAEASPHLTIDTNVSGTNNMIQLCKIHNAKLVYFSTSEVYGNDTPGKMCESVAPHPNNRYGLSKYLGEILVEYEVKNYDLDAIIIRPFMIYDENETRGIHRSAMVRFAESLLKGENIIVHEGARRSWLYVTDAVVIIEELIHTFEFHIVNVGNPNVVYMLALAKMMCDEIGIDYGLITEAPLPPRMTLQKEPNLTLQHDLTNFEDFTDLEIGISKLIKRLRCS